MGGKRHAEKERYWRSVVGGAARSGVPVREFCGRPPLNARQFHWWRRRLKQTRHPRPLVGAPSGAPASVGGP
ncbi:MAG: hypothetical protein AAB403_09565, partial [Planctomycetota bacterium]